MKKRVIVIVLLIVLAVWLYVKYQEYQDYIVERRVSINKQLAEARTNQQEIEAKRNLVEIFDNSFERKDGDLYWKDGWADKYLQSIQLRDNELRKKAVEVTSQCSVNDKSCQTFFVYDWVVKNLKYVSDPRGQDDYVQNPHNTIEIGGGDCEDLTAVTMSMLENLGVRTYMILTDDHAYALACGVDIKEIEKNIFGNSKPIETYNNEFLIKQNYYRTIDLEDSEKSVTYDFKLEADNPVDFLILDSKEEVNKKVNELKYSYYPTCSREGTKKFEVSCTLNGGSVYLENSLDKPSYVKFSILQKVSPQNVKVTYYQIDGDNCIILESTAGKYGYPGYAGETENKTKIAIDPYTHKSYQLK